jgi:hypothetical protein
MVTPAARREAAAPLRQVHEASQRRACQVIGADRSSIRYRRRRPDDGIIRSRFARSPLFGAASAIAGGTCCCGARGFC